MHAQNLPMRISIKDSAPTVEQWEWDPAKRRSEARHALKKALDIATAAGQGEEDGPLFFGHFTNKYNNQRPAPPRPKPTEPLSPRPKPMEPLSVMSAVALML
jgi:hypothetical protein